MITKILKEQYEPFIVRLKKNIVEQVGSAEFREFVQSLDIKLSVCPQGFLENYGDSNVSANERSIIAPEKQMIAYIVSIEEVKSYTEKNSKEFADIQDSFLKSSDTLYVIQEQVTTKNDQNVYSFTLIWYINLGYAYKDIEKKYIAKTILEIIRKKVEYIESIDTNTKDFKWQDIKFLALYFDALKQEFMLPECQQLCTLSKLSYENRKNKGIMCFRKNNELPAETVLFVNDKTEKVDFDEIVNLYHVRKLLEMSNSNYEGDVRKCLLFDDLYQCRGIIKENDIKDSNLLIYFDGIDKWQLSYNNKIILKYDGGQFFLNEQQKKEIDLDKLPISGEYKEIYGDILQCLSKQKYGALMIIAEDAQNQIDRLCVQYERGTKIDPFKITKENLCFLSGFCSVDGAIFMDFLGCCYGYGVILDGEAKIKGMPERGARYNSAANYIAGTKRYAVVVSEDKDKGLTIIAPSDYEVISK